MYDFTHKKKSLNYISLSKFSVFKKNKNSRSARHHSNTENTTTNESIPNEKRTQLKSNICSIYLINTFIQNKIKKIEK